MLARINRNYVPAYWDDFFNDAFFNNYNSHGRQGTSNSVNMPAVNVIEDEKAYRIEVAAPGLSRDDFRIDLENDLLTFSSERKENKEDKNSKTIRKEFSYSSFKRSFQIPDTIDQEKIHARTDAGILTIELPKKEEVVQKAPKKIEIS